MKKSAPRPHRKAKRPRTDRGAAAVKHALRLRPTGYGGAASKGES